eukprot:4267113-Amphidinium_carterae.1
MSQNGLSSSGSAQTAWVSFAGLSCGPSFASQSTPPSVSEPQTEGLCQLSPLAFWLWACTPASSGCL